MIASQTQPEDVFSTGTDVSPHPGLSEIRIPLLNGLQDIEVILQRLLSALAAGALTKAN